MRPQCRGHHWLHITNVSMIGGRGSDASGVATGDNHSTVYVYSVDTLLPSADSNGNNVGHVDGTCNEDSKK